MGSKSIFNTPRSLKIMVGFYLLAGLNHFAIPTFYIPLIPDYLPFPVAINIIAGLVEIGLAVALFFPSSRRIACFLIIAMLIAFIPSHVHFIREGSCDGILCVPHWIGWTRLIIVHPFLIYWAYSVRSVDRSILKRS